MIAKILEEAGFLAIEPEGATVWARLSANGPEFRADPEHGVHILTLIWPVRLDAAALAAWNEAATVGVLDLYAGETRLRMAVESLADALDWRAAADSVIQACVRFRRGQRARGEGF